MRRFLLLTFSVVLLFGCGKTSVSPTGTGHIPQQEKKPPEYRKIPSTQRPYKINRKRYYPIPSSEGFRQTGIASWYGRKFHGRKTSNGETYNMYKMTAAHKTLPMNTHVLVKNLENGKELTTRINDRGPFVKGRIIDLSLKGARDLGIVEKGTARVQITALGEAVTITENNKKIEKLLPHEDFQSGDFYVQIGSFTNKVNAVRLREKMKSWGKSAVITTFNRGDAIFHRVQVKAGNRLEDASRMERVLTDAGFPDSFVVAR